MNQIDLHLQEAWERIGERCREDRVEALRRSRRRHLAGMKRPPRAWCLCIRAADSRIGLHNAVFDFPSWFEQPEDDPTPQDAFIRDGETYESALERGVTHRLTLTGSVIRDLTAPVTIRYPGIPIKKVAALLGRHYLNVYRWIDRSDPYPYSSTEGTKRALARRPGESATQAINRASGLKLWGYTYPGIHRKDGGRGMPMAIVYTPSPIDPNHEAGLPPDPVWGSIWQGLHLRLPECFEQTFERIAVRGSRKGRFRGWHWKCPGLIDETGEHAGCGRAVRALYAPMPVWTLGESGAGALELQMPDDSGLAGTWRPGEHESPIGQGNRCFACKECWQVNYPRMSDGTGWNMFVSYISGGLLQGHEVARPIEEAPLTRRNAVEAVDNRKAPRAEEAARLLAQGMKTSDIARAMGITRIGVNGHIQRAIRRHQVASRAELIEKLRNEQTQPNVRAHAI